jgi:hypothetical protein
LQTHEKRSELGARPCFSKAEIELGAGSSLHLRKFSISRKECFFEVSIFLLQEERIALAIQGYRCQVKELGVLGRSSNL